MSKDIELVASVAVKKAIPEEWWKGQVQTVLDDIEAGESEMAKTFAQTGGPLRKSVEWKSIFVDPPGGFAPVATEKPEKTVEMVIRRVNDSILAVVGFADEIGELEKQHSPTDNVQVEIACSDKVTEVYTKEEITDIVNATIDRLATSPDKLDGVRNLGMMHYFENVKGRVDTFAIYIRTGANAPITIHVGMPDEIKKLQDMFAKTCNDSGAKVRVIRSPKLRAHERRKKRKRLSK